MLAAVASRLSVGACTVVLPDGRRVVAEGSREPGLRAVIDVKATRAGRRLWQGGSIGLAEAYIDGDWDSPNLALLLEVALRNQQAIAAAAPGGPAVRMLDRLRHLLRTNTRAGSRRNVAHHYDLGNAFYRAWLGDEMTYSAGLFDAADRSLEEAHTAKFDRIAGLLALSDRHRLLDLGCGWGGFAMRAAAQHGCRVVGLTLSRRQALHARAQARGRRLDDRVEIRLGDYRDLRGRFDRIASIEMLEAVGEAYWPTYFQVLCDCLAPGGVAALQVITIDDARFSAYRKRPDFIQRYIFPGGMLPSPTALSQEIGGAGLRVTDTFSFGASYATTLACWQERFQQSWPSIRSLGFPSRFKRMWEYYLAYCEAGFRAGVLDVRQLRVEKSP